MNPQHLDERMEPAYKSSLHTRMKEWAWRYGPAELIGTAAAYFAFFTAREFTDSMAMAAYAATLGENIGFYGTIIAREVVHDMRDANEEGKSYSFRGASKTAGKLFAEFGPGEFLDSLVIRPAAMGFGARFLGENIGVLAGKVTADVIFYVPTIISYEIRKHFSNTRTPEDM